MKRIALICSFGLSTSLLTDRMAHAAAVEGIEVHVQAIGASELSDVVEEVDVLLLAPQVRYMKPSVEKYNKPVAVIDGFAYAMADGTKVLQQAVGLLESGRQG
jgi:cellobiose PTS system EIIB component